MQVKVGYCELSLQDDHCMSMLWCTVDLVLGIAWRAKPISAATMLLCIMTRVNGMMWHSTLYGLRAYYANVYLFTPAEREEQNLHLICITVVGVQEKQDLGQ